MLDNKGDTGLFTMDRHDDPAVWSDVRLTEQSDFVTQHRVCQVILINTNINANRSDRRQGVQSVDNICKS